MPPEPWLPPPELRSPAPGSSYPGTGWALPVGQPAPLKPPQAPAPGHPGAAPDAHLWLTWDPDQLRTTWILTLVPIPLVFVIVVGFLIPSAGFGSLAVAPVLGVFFVLAAVATLAQHRLIRRWGIELSPWGVRVQGRYGQRRAAWTEITAIDEVTNPFVGKGTIRFVTTTRRFWASAPTRGSSFITDPDFDAKLDTLHEWWQRYRLLPPGAVPGLGARGWGPFPSPPAARAGRSPALPWSGPSPASPAPGSTGPPTSPPPAALPGAEEIDLG